MPRVFGQHSFLKDVTCPPETVFPYKMLKAPSTLQQTTVYKTIANALCAVKPG
jgi:hypothetical protein